ncbi:MAG: hypothetical protein R2771_03480 [Saprospiraceae bacterium]
MFEYNYSLADLMLFKEPYDNFTSSIKWNKGKSYYWGLKLGLNFNRNSDIVIGLQLDRIKFEQTGGFGFWSCQPEYYGANKIISESRFINILTVEIPVELRYNIRKFRRITFFPSIGIVPVIFISKKQNVEFLFDNNKTGTHPYNDISIVHNRKINFAFQLKIGGSYQITKRLATYFEPFYSIFLGKDEILEDYLNTRIYKIGISGGIQYIFDFKKYKIKHK